MIFISRTLSIFSLFLLLFTVIKSPRGIWGGVIWLPKLWAGAWAPWLALAAGASAVLGWVSGDLGAVLTGVLAAVLGVRHTVIVTRPYHNFREAFGEGWEARIPPEMKARLQARRYQLIQPTAPAVPGTRNIVLGKTGDNEEVLLGDLWTPPEGVTRSGLALIYLHGGLWQALDKDFLTQPLFRRLAGEGHVILDVAYSLTPTASLERMLGDVKQAILWMKAHAGEYGVNPDRIVLMGVSGGAHLALLAAYAPQHPAFQRVQPQADMRVRAVVAMSAVTDMRRFFMEYGQTNPKQPESSSQIADDLRPYVHDQTWFDRFITRQRLFPAYRHANLPGGALLLVYLMGGTPKDVPDAYRMASPLVYAGKHCPPTLQICAGEDFVINPGHGRRLHAALQEAGATSVYVEIPETVHGFDQYFGVSRRIAPAVQAATQDVERFLTLMCGDAD